MKYVVHYGDLFSVKEVYPRGGGLWVNGRVGGGGDESRGHTETAVEYENRGFCGAKRDKGRITGGLGGCPLEGGSSFTEDFDFYLALYERRWFAFLRGEIRALRFIRELFRGGGGGL